MADTFSNVFPLFKAIINRVFIGIDQCTASNRLLHLRFDGSLLNILDHVNDDLSASLNHAEYWRLFLGQSPASTRAF